MRNPKAFRLSKGHLALVSATSRIQKGDDCTTAVLKLSSRGCDGTLTRLFRTPLAIHCAAGEAVMRTIILPALFTVIFCADPALAQSTDSGSSDNGAPLRTDSHADMNTGGGHSDIARDHSAANANASNSSGTSGSSPPPSSPQDKSQPNHGDALQKKTAPAVSGAGHIDF
jgi:hypothetical protein